MGFAVDPWRGPGHRLILEEKPSGAAILSGITEILASWPREATALLGDEDRHLRLILAVSGYPEIDAATRPFDWPLHEKSAEALSVSRMIDDVEGIHQGTSLRSSILNRDMNYRLGDDKLKVAHKDCLLALFARTRQLDGRPLNQTSYFDEELDLLTMLHSQDNNRRNIWWPDLGHKTSDLESYENTHPNSQPENPSMGEISKKHSKNSPQFKEAEEKKQAWLAYRKFENFKIPVTDLEEVTFQFHHVQNWIGSVVPSRETFDGTIQRFTRGASLLLELVSSEALQRIAREVGIGSVIVDGGGRVSFLCPSQRVKDVTTSIESSSNDFLSVDPKKSFSGNNVRLETTLRNWAGACHRSGQGISGETDSPIKEDYDLWYAEARAKLPPISVRSLPIGHSEEATEPNSIADIVSSLEGTNSPRVMASEVEKAQANSCCICNDEEVPKKEAKKIDHWMGLEGGGEPTQRACSFHRLLYFLGHDQRIKDSTLRIRAQAEATEDEDESEEGAEGESGDGAEGTTISDSGRTRSVTSIAVLDGNSLGVIFAERHWDNYEISQRLDRTRRRSFRFNHHWWKSIRESINEFGSGDSIAAWVTAGDDVTLAQYEETPPPGEKWPDPQRLLETMLYDLARRIEEELDDGIFLSFGAGLAIKMRDRIKVKDSDETVTDRIRTQLSRAKALEKVAKDVWKTKAEKEWKAMMTLPPRWEGDGRESKDVSNPIEGKEGDWAVGSRSVIISDATRLNEVEEEGEEEPPFEIGFDHGWEPAVDDAVSHAIEKLGIGDNDYPLLLSWLNRHHVRAHKDGKTLVVMPPKEIQKKPYPNRILIPVGGSRANIIAVCKMGLDAEVRLLLSRSMFPTEESARELVGVIGGHASSDSVSYEWIEGPDKGPVTCRDSIQEWAREDSQYSPDQIFVTSATTLIQSTLALLFPSAELLALRGRTIVRLSDETELYEVEELEPEEYLAIHGIEIIQESGGDGKAGQLRLKGKTLPAPPIDEFGIHGNRMSLTWRFQNNPEVDHKKNADAQKIASQSIGSSIKQIVESAGLGSFRFSVLGYGKFATVSTDPRIVRIGSGKR